MENVGYEVDLQEGKGKACMCRAAVREDRYHEKFEKKGGKKHNTSTRVSDLGGLGGNIEALTHP